ncbi:hypothetical protein M3Y97_00796800 [Aphelenchoides bicaudatus]|nr:hypothetical protein M3Y97_00796800 [Aphelenchoides bicaudatus]
MDCKLVNHTGWKNKCDRDNHENFCPNGKPCSLDPPCDTIFMSKTSMDQHFHYVCIICGQKLSSKPGVEKHEELHPSWGQKFAESLEELMTDNPAATDKAQNVYSEYLKSVEAPKLNEKKCAPYLIMCPTEIVPQTFADFLDLIAYPGKSLIVNNRTVVLQSRYNGYNIGNNCSEPMHAFFDSYANSPSKPIFFAPTDFLSTTDAADHEKLMIYVLGLQNLINESYGNALSSGFEDWSAKNKSRLGAQLLFNAYKKFKSLPLDSHPRITYSRLNDPKWLKKQAAKKTLVSAEALQQMISLGHGNFEAFTIDGKLVIEPSVKPEAELEEAPHISSGDSQSSRKRKLDQ